MLENSSLAPRNRRRRDRDVPRRGYVEEQEKPSSGRAQEKHHARTPLRYVPDAAGFDALTKLEIKSDMREIEKNVTMLPPFDHESEGDAALVISSSKPPCPPESNIAKKRKRYITWINNPEFIEQDMAKYQTALQQIKNEYQEIVDDELRWADTFMVVRRHLVTQIKLLDEESKELQSQAKQLYSLCVEEAGIHSRKRRTMHMRDVLSELHDRNQEMMNQITEHKKLVSEAGNIPGMDWVNCPSKYELGVESLGYRARDAVSTPFGKGVVKMVDDRRPQRAGIVVVVKLDFAIAYLQYHQVQHLNKWARKPTAATNEQAPMDIGGQRLLSRFSSAEERLRLAEANLGDLESLLPDDDEEGESGDSLDGFIEEPLATRRREEQAAAALYLMNGPSHDDSFWLRQLGERADKQHSRRKRRATTAIECNTTLLPRTPYQVPLLLSPVSQFPDRYLGALYGGDPTVQKTASYMRIPQQLHHAENVALGNQQLLASVARAKILLKRLENAKEDWERQLEESGKTFDRTRGIYQSLETESEMLYAQHRRDLAAWQISKGAAAQVGEADLLLAAQADAQQRSARSSGRGNGRGRRGRTRVPSKGDPLTLSQESAASNGTEVELDNDKSLENAASVDSEALAIGALTSLGAVAADEDMDDDVEKKAARRRVVRRRNR